MANNDPKRWSVGSYLVECWSVHITSVVNTVFDNQGKCKLIKGYTEYPEVNLMLVSIFQVLYYLNQL